MRLKLKTWGTPYAHTNDWIDWIRFIGYGFKIFFIQNGNKDLNEMGDFIKRGIEKESKWYYFFNDNDNDIKDDNNNKTRLCVKESDLNIYLNQVILFGMDLMHHPMQYYLWE